LRLRLQEHDRSLEELETRRASQRQQEAALSEKIRQVQEVIDPVELELQALENQQENEQKAEAASRHELNMAEHFNAQVRISLARQQEELDTLRRRIEDDFGLVAFDYVDQVSGPTPLPLEGMVEQLPHLSQLPADLDESIRRMRGQLRRMGAINPESQVEYREVKQRFEFLSEQVIDLEQAEADIRRVIVELDTLMEREFHKTFQAVAAEFRQTFTRLFGGGSARLILTQPEDLTQTGIDIEARLPGRRMQGLSLLSGGERSLTAAALVFSLLKVSPTPFCVLDEVDAMLDEMNVGRFLELLRELSENSQFVIITHNRNTVQAADVIYGVTMGRDSVSQVLSLRVDEVAQLVKGA
jgi:chromosome segregation protein